MDIGGKVSVATGGASGLGEAAVRTLLSRCAGIAPSERIAGRNGPHSLDTYPRRYHQLGWDLQHAATCRHRHDEQ